MKGCFFITRKDSLHGFSLAGFQQVEADRENVLKVFAGIAKHSEPALVFIDERLLTEKNLSRLVLMEKEWGGAIVSLPVPGKGFDTGTVDYGKKFISRVLGYQLKLS